MSPKNPEIVDTKYISINLCQFYSGISELKSMFNM